MVIMNLINRQLLKTQVFVIGSRLYDSYEDYKATNIQHVFLVHIGSIKWKRIRMNIVR